MTLATGTMADAVSQALVEAGRYNKQDRVRPDAVLWPDPGELWTPIVDLLRERLPVFTLGDYDVETQTGPAIWLRCALPSARPGADDDALPIVYLPGVERADLRAIETCEARIRPLAELQFRSSWWQAANQSPWTPASFLRSADGLGLDLARDAKTADALMMALDKVALASVEDLRRKGRLDSTYFAGLLNADVVKTMLDWISDPTVTTSKLAPNEWAAFLTQARSSFDVDPEAAGRLSVARLLGERQGEWAKAWDRFAEAPSVYPGVAEQLRRAKPEDDHLWSETSDAWPQDNEEAEAELGLALSRLKSGTSAEARQRIRVLESEHGPRRLSVWGRLGQAPLATALEHLAFVAEHSADTPSPATLADFKQWFASEGYRVDAAAMQSLSLVNEPTLRDQVGVALRATYLPWLDYVARAFQDLVLATHSEADLGLKIEDGDCVIFVDGLRLDVGEQLRSRLGEHGVDAEVNVRMATFPTMTPSGKPAVAPLGIPLAGGDGITPTAGGRVVDAPLLRELLAESGVQVVGRDETGDPAGRGWTETGDLDAAGHKLGLKLVDRIAPEVDDIASRTRQLLAGGWRRVHVVTDHGWLLMPGGLTKVELPLHLTTVRKTRCARLSDGAGQVDQPTVAWSWDDGVRIAVPRGAAAFEAGCIYEHGGISPQESLTPHVVVTGAGSSSSVSIEAVKWLGLRCRIDLHNGSSDVVADVRLSPGDAASSIVTAAKAADEGDEVRLLVPDDAHTGSNAYVVLLSASGEILAQVATKVGE